MSCRADLWATAGNRQSTRKNCIDVLEKVSHLQLSGIRHTLFSFTNGVLDVENERFHPGGAGIPDDVIVGAFHHCDFHIHDDLRGGFQTGDWFQIPTQPVDHILDSQVRDAQQLFVDS